MIGAHHRILHSAPERMTTRARVFLLVVAGRNTAIGISLLLAGRQYGAPNVSFELVRSAMPIPVWGILMVAIGSVAGYSAAAASRGWATWAIALSATISGTWATCLGIQFIQTMHIPGGMAPMLPVLWAALTAKDLVIAWQPMRSPFEPWIQRLLREGQPPPGEVT